MAAARSAPLTSRLTGAVPAGAVSPVVPGVAGDAVISPNLTHVGWIPTDAGAVSMRVVQVGAQYDIRDRTKPVKLPRDQWWGELTGAGSGHALHQDSAGVWVADPI